MASGVVEVSGALSLIVLDIGATVCWSSDSVDDAVKPRLVVTCAIPKSALVAD